MDFIDDEHVKSISFTEEDIVEMEAILADDKNQALPEFWQKKYRTDQGKNWELFYKRNTTNFFKDRSWLHREFDLDDLTRLSSGEKPWKLIDIGCGVGNGLFPVLKAYRNIKAYGFDVSKRAIDLLRERCVSQLDESSSTSFGEQSRIEKLGVWDLIKNEAPTTCYAFDEASRTFNPCVFSEAGEMDAGLLLFVLSAIPLENIESVITKIGQLIKPGGLLLFRDYGRYDQKEIRFAERSDAKLGDHCYVRQDGTLAVYFDKDCLNRLFEVHGGFEVVSSQYITRQFMNRKTGQKLNRCWIQAVFQKASPVSSD